MVCILYITCSLGVNYFATGISKVEQPTINYCCGRLQLFFFLIMSSQKRYVKIHSGPIDGIYKFIETVVLSKPDRKGSTAISNTGVRRQCHFGYNSTKLVGCCSWGRIKYIKYRPYDGTWMSTQCLKNDTLLSHKLTSYSSP